MPHTFIRGHVLADLVAEYSEPSLEEEVKKQHMDGKLVGMVSLQESLSQRVYVEGATN